MGIYLGLVGPLLLADLPDGTRVAHVDSQLRAQITDEPADVNQLTSAPLAAEAA